MANGRGCFSAAVVLNTGQKLPCYDVRGVDCEFYSPVKNQYDAINEFMKEYFTELLEPIEVWVQLHEDDGGWDGWSLHSLSPIMVEGIPADGEFCQHLEDIGHQLLDGSTYYYKR